MIFHHNDQLLKTQDTQSKFIISCSKLWDINGTFQAKNRTLFFTKIEQFFSKKSRIFWWKSSNSFLQKVWHDSFPRSETELSTPKFWSISPTKLFKFYSKKLGKLGIDDTGTPFPRGQMWFPNLANFLENFEFLGSNNFTLMLTFRWLTAAAAEVALLSKLLKIVFDHRGTCRGIVVEAIEKTASTESSF